MSVVEGTVSSLKNKMVAIVHISNQLRRSASAPDHCDGAECRQHDLRQSGDVRLPGRSVVRP